MSITDELRESMSPCISDGWLTITRSAFERVADRIEESHAAQVKDLRDELARLHRALDALQKDYNRQTRRVQNQRRQLTGVQLALQRRNEGELKKKWRKEVERLQAELDELKGRTVELPLDADGVPIRIGDVLDCHANGYDGTFKVFAIGEKSVVGNHTAELIRKNPYSWFHIAKFCHHHTQTTEDVLIELIEKAVGYSEAHTTTAYSAVEDAAKHLQLRSDA